MSFLLVPAIAFVVALIATPLAGRLGERLGIVDVPGPRRVHCGAIPRLGGIGIYTAFLFALVLLFVLPENMLPPRQDAKEMVRLSGLLIGSTFMFLVGLIDDKWELGPLPQLVSQLVGAGIAYASLIFIERVMNPFSDELVVFPWPLVLGFTVFWIVGMANTVNWLDGMDGLAAGVAAIACVVLSIHMYREGQFSVALLPLALLGSTLGFLPYNLHPARVFMGSCGSFFLGFALATLGIIAGAKMASVLLVMGIPIIDVAYQIASRRMRHQEPWQADLGHLHYRLLECGLNPRQIVLVFYAFSAIFGGVALLTPSRMYKLYAILGLAVATVVSLVMLTRRTCPPNKQ